MRQVTGSTFEIRDELKALGCLWDSYEKAWFANDEVHSRAQALADEATWREWNAFLDTLVWAPGEFTSTVWNGALRAGSLGVSFASALAEISQRVRVHKQASDAWFSRNVGRGYDAGAVDMGREKVWSGSAAAAGGEPQKAPVKRAVFAPEMLTKVAGEFAKVVDAGWLADRSPVDPLRVSSDDFLSALFEAGERVMVFDEFKSQGQWVWSSDEGFRPSRVLPAALYERSVPPENAWDVGAGFTGVGREGIWYLCAPVTGEWAWMQEGGSDPHWSRRFQDCVTSWRYMVFESDEARAREWVGAVVQLPLRVVAIYTSGSRSIHVLVRMDARNKVQWDAWRDEVKPILVSLGADKGCFSGVRLTRLPGCARLGKEKDGVYEAYPRPAKQKLLYLDPGAGMVPIYQMPRLRRSVEQWGRVGEALAGTDPSERDVETVEGFRRAVGHFEGAAQVQKWKGVLA